MADKEQAKPDPIDKILTRLLADVDDNMEFLGTLFNPKDNASKKVSGSLAKARVSIEAFIASERAEAAKEELGLIAWDDNLSDELKDELYEKYTKARLAQLTPTEGGK